VDTEIAVAKTESIAARSRGDFSQRKVTRLHDDAVRAGHPIYAPA
jgi:hypothetical protein